MYICHYVLSFRFTSLCLYVFKFICLYFYTSVCLCVCLTVNIYVYLSICLFVFSIFLYVIILYVNLTVRALSLSLSLSHSHSLSLTRPICVFDLQIRVTSDLPGVDHNLQDHIGFDVPIGLTEPLSRPFTDYSALNLIKYLSTGTGNIKS